MAAGFQDSKSTSSLADKGWAQNWQSIASVPSCWLKPVTKPVKVQGKVKGVQVDKVTCVWLKERIC